MNARYKPGDYEARHNAPAWQDRANFVIAADIATSPEKREWEQLWVRMISDKRFEICCIPFFAHGLALGDEVEVDDDYVVQRVLVASGHITLRVWFGNSKDSVGRTRVMELIDHEKCEHEWSSLNLLAIDARTSKTAQDIVEVLTALQNEGAVEFETRENSPPG